MNEVEFQHLLLKTVGLGLAAFFICGAALAFFLRSLDLDSRNDREGMSGRTKLALTLLVLSLVAFCLIFVLIAFSEG